MRKRNMINCERTWQYAYLIKTFIIYGYYYLILKKIRLEHELSYYLLALTFIKKFTSLIITFISYKNK